MAHGTPLISNCSAASPSEFGIWETTATTSPNLTVLADDIETDTLIIGAGFTGLSTALHLAESGAKPVLIEALSPGWGASGRNTGWLEPNWWMQSPRSVERYFGKERADELTPWVASGPRILQQWRNRYQLGFEFDQRGLLMATDNPRKAAALENEARDWQAAGVENAYLDASAISTHVSSDRYLGAILLKDGAVLNPLSLCRELSTVCLKLKVPIYHHTPAQSISRQNNYWVTHTPRARITSRQLVLATDAYTANLWPSLRKAYCQWNAAVIASRPYPAIKKLLTTDIPFADLNIASMFTIRKTADDRLVTSALAPWRTGAPPNEAVKPFMRKFRKVFPDFPLPEWEYAHFGVVGMTRNMLPSLCKIGPDAWTVFGYSGTGINLALLLGGELAKLTRDGEAPIYPLTPLTDFPLRTLSEWGLKYILGPVSRGLISRWI